MLSYMSTTALIAKNTLVQVLGRIGGTILGIMTLAVMTRYLDANGYGAFTTITTFLQFFGIIVDFGLSMTALAMLSEPNADKGRVTSNILTLRVISAAVFFALAPAIVLFFPYSGAVKAGVAVGALSFFLISLNQILVAVLQQEMRAGRAAVAEVLGRAGLFAGAWAVVWLDRGLLWMIAALALGNAVNVVWNWILVRKLVPLRWSADLVVWKDIVRRSWPIGAAIVFNLVYLKGDVIILSLVRGQEEVGLYGAAYKIIDVLTVVPMMFMALVLPLLVKARSSNDGEGWKRVLQKSFDFMAILALPLAFGAWVTGADLMRWIAGEGFESSGDMLKILMLAVAAVFFGSMFGHAVVAAGKQKQMIWGYASDAVLSIAAYLIFIPARGAVAAAWVTVFSEAYIAVATFLMVWRTTGFAPRIGVFLRAALSAALMAAIVRGLPADWHILLKIGVGIAAYAVLTFATGAITKKRLRELVPAKSDQLTA